MNTKLLNKFMNTGDVISDEELKELYTYYRNIEKALLCCPPEYSLIQRDVWSKLDRLTMWKNSRKEK